MRRHLCALLAMKCAADTTTAAQWEAERAPTRLQENQPVQRSESAHRHPSGAETPLLRWVTKNSAGSAAQFANPRLAEPHTHCWIPLHARANCPRRLEVVEFGLLSYSARLGSMMIHVQQPAMSILRSLLELDISFSTRSLGDPGR